MIFVESAGRSDARASKDLDGAAGLTQILAETGRDLLALRVDVRTSERLTRGIARGRRVAARARRRRVVDERFDPPKALEATARYLELARRTLGRDDLAVVSYHMGIGNLQAVLRAYGRRRRSLRSALLRLIAGAPRARVRCSRPSATTPRRTCGGCGQPRQSCAAGAPTPTPSSSSRTPRPRRPRPRRSCIPKTAPARSPTPTHLLQERLRGLEPLQGDVQRDLGCVLADLHPRRRVSLDKRVQTVISSVP